VLLPVPHGKADRADEELVKHDVDVSWWVTPETYEHGYYQKLYAALRHWVAEAFPFTTPYDSNLEIPERD
jgi:hypothetical protein